MARGGSALTAGTKLHHPQPSAEPVAPKAPQPKEPRVRTPDSPEPRAWIHGFMAEVLIFVTLVTLHTEPPKKLVLPVLVESRSTSKGKELARGGEGVQGKSKRAAFHGLSRAGARLQSTSCRGAALNSGA